MKTDGKSRLILYSVLIAIFAILSGNLGMSTFKIDLTVFSENLFLANITYLGFLIVIIERVVEVMKTNFMEPQKLRLLADLKEHESNLCLNLKSYLGDASVQALIKNLKPEEYDEIHELEYIVCSQSNINLNEYQVLKQKCKDAKYQIALHANKTRNFILLCSLVIAGTLSCLGCANFLYPLLDSSLFVKDSLIPEPYLVEGVSAVITSWSIAAGSDGWNTVTDWAGKAINSKKGTL